MNKNTKTIFSLFISSGIIFFLFLGIGYNLNEFAGDVRLRIQGLGIRHGTPDNINLGSLSTSGNEQQITGQLNDYFRVEDIEGYITGHYTTIQCDGIYGPSGYILSGVYVQAGNTNPTLLLGNASSNVYISPLLYTYTSIMNPVTYIYKTTSPTNIGVVNKYGDKPYFKIIIPAYAPPGSYSGTIVFSFYSY